MDGQMEGQINGYQEQRLEKGMGLVEDGAGESALPKTLPCGTPLPFSVSSLATLASLQFLEHAVFSYLRVLAHVLPYTWNAFPCYSSLSFLLLNLQV